MRKNYLNGILISSALGVGALNAGCVDLALIGINAAIRQEQNKKLIQQRRQIDYGAAQRDYRNYNKMDELIKQNKELMRRLERYEGSNNTDVVVFPNSQRNNRDLMDDLEGISTEEKKEWGKAIVLPILRKREGIRK